MAIIKPSKKFTGSEVDLRDIGRYVKPDTRQVFFGKKYNPEGAWLYFLPAYKQDAAGNGVWYKTFRIRDNFGDKFKDKYAVLDGGDPVEYFERNFKIYYPEDAKVIDELNDKGQSRKRYPFYGRTTTRVLYNVAYVNGDPAGVHILDLPAYNGASIINEWLKGKDRKGIERPVLNEPEHCIPVFIKLKDGGGAPWQIEPEQSDASAIPDELADSDNLYNLDDVFIRKDPAELIDRLRNMYSKEIFEQCMDGYVSDDVVVTGSRPALVKKSAPTATAVVNSAKQAVEDDEVPMEFVVQEEANPVVSKNEAEAAKKFLERKVK